MRFHFFHIYFSLYEDFHICQNEERKDADDDIVSTIIPTQQIQS